MAASLTIRNLSPTPLELILVERFQTAKTTPTPADGENGAPGLVSGVGHFLWGLVRAPWGIASGVAAGTCGNGNSSNHGFEPLSADARPFGREAISDVEVAPFQTHRTRVPVADPKNETMRLTFAARFEGFDTGDGQANDVYHRDHRTRGKRRVSVRHYTVDIPAATARSLELQPVDASTGNARAEDDGHEPAPGKMSNSSGGSSGSKASAAGFTAVYTPHRAHLAIVSSAALASWMATVDGAWPLSSLSLPGTHNSPACYVSFPSVRCQAVDVRTQLENGVRFLDVRVSVAPATSAGHHHPHTDPRLSLVHSAFPVSLASTRWFSDLYAAVCTFLDEHPTETVLLCVKREGTGRGTDADLAHQLLHYCLSPVAMGGSSGDSSGDGIDPPKLPSSSNSHSSASAQDGRHRSRWYTEPRVPTLDEVRGRIVLIRRFRLPQNDAIFEQLHSGRGWGIDASVWPDNCADGSAASGHLRLQDFYQVRQAANIETKIGYAKAHLERAASQLFTKASPAVAAAAAAGRPGHPPLFVNFLSGSNFFNATCWPENIAARVNPALVEHLCVHHGDAARCLGPTSVGDASTGIVVTDWVGVNGDWDLIRCIVAWNARLQLKS